MSKSPLALYKETAKKFGVTEAMQVPDVAKLSFVRSQVQEQQSIINRLLVDLTLSYLHAENAKDENTKAAYTNKASGYENDLRQLVATLSIDLELLAELEPLTQDNTQV